MLIKSQYNRPRTRTLQHGTSLIEILVVLVVLVIGILSIVRLFPAGFIALRNAENATFADRLAQGALESLKKNNAGLPDGIYMATSAGFVPTFSPEDPSYLSQYTDSDGLPANDLNKERYISNETITIPGSRVVNMTAYPPLYTVNYGPIYLPSTSTPGNYLTVNGVPWTAQTGSSGPDPNNFNSAAVRSIDNPTDILQPGQSTFLVDYNAGQIAVPTATYPNGQTFMLSVVDSKGNAFQATVMEPASYTGDWFAPTLTGTGTNTLVLPWKSATLYRPFACQGVVGSNTNFDADPYEYEIFSSNIAGASGNTVSTANIGVLAFNPLASGQNGAQALKARISYEALDWHILHEDQDVPGGTPTVRLTLNHLKKIGDIQFDQSVFNSLIPNATPADLILLDLDTGTTTLLNSTATGNVQDTDDNSGNTAGAYQVSYQNGHITFPDGTAEQHLRIFYAGDADWAVAMQKASSVYSAANSVGALTATGPLPNDYVVDAANDKVYFPPCDAGKTVEFDGINYTVVASSGTVQKTIAVATAAISTDLDATYKVPYVNLSSGGLNSSGIIPDTGTISNLSFTAVRGVSARAVVIWHERNNWRVRTTDTLLTQTP